MPVGTLFSISSTAIQKLLNSTSQLHEWRGRSMLFIWETGSSLWAVGAPSNCAREKRFGKSSTSMACRTAFSASLQIFLQFRRKGGRSPEWERLTCVAPMAHLPSTQTIPLRLRERSKVGRLFLFKSKTLG